MAQFADLVGLIGLLAMQGVAVLIGVHRDRIDAEFVGGPEGSNGNLAAVGDQDLGEHASKPIRRTSRRGTAGPTRFGLPAQSTNRSPNSALLQELLAFLVDHRGHHGGQRGVTLHQRVIFHQLEGVVPGLLDDCAVAQQRKLFEAR